MKRQYVLLSLIVLSLSAIANVGLAWWPNNWYMPTTARNLSTPVAHAIELETGAIQADTKDIARKQAPEPDLITTAEASTFPGNPADDLSHEEIEVLRNLRSTKAALDARAKMLNERQKSIEEAEKGIAKRVDELESLLTRIQDRLQQEESIRSKKIKRLTAVYASMKPEKSALVIAKMELTTVVKMFTRMDEKKVGKILSYLPPEQAVKITQALSKQISSLN